MVVTLLDLGSGSGGGLIVPELQQESESGTPVRRRTAIKRSPATTSKCCIEHHLLARNRSEFPSSLCPQALADGTDQLGRGEDVSCDLLIPPPLLAVHFRCPSLSSNGD